MCINGFPIAALILPDNDGLDPAPYLNDAGELLSEYERLPVRLLNDRIIGEDMIITVSTREDGDFGPQVELAILTHDGLPADHEDARTMLAELILRSAQHSSFDLIAWQSGETLSEREAFVSHCAALGVTGQHRTELNELRDVLTAPQEPEEPADPQSSGPLLTRRPDTPPQASRINAAGWLMTATLAIVNLPVATALTIVGLGRGMDFRLVAQVLSVTMLFVVLSNATSLDKIVDAVMP